MYFKGNKVCQEKHCSHASSLKQRLRSILKSFLLQLHLGANVGFQAYRTFFFFFKSRHNIENTELRKTIPNVGTHLLSGLKRHRKKDMSWKREQEECPRKNLKNSEHLCWMHLYAITGNVFIKLVLVENLKKKLVFFALTMTKG